MLSALRATEGYFHCLALTLALKSPLQLRLHVSCEQIGNFSSFGIKKQVLPHLLLILCRSTPGMGLLLRHPRVLLPYGLVLRYLTLLLVRFRLQALPRRIGFR